MFPRVKDVRATDDYNLILVFENGEVRKFSVRPYLEKGIFNKLKDKNYFRKVKVVLGSVAWQDGQDFCPDTLYLESVPLE